VSYGYNSAAQLNTLTTPSGQQIGYSYTNNRVSGITINGQTLLYGATTEPFGPVALWFWGNGLKMWRDYDTDGRLITWEFRNGTAVLRKDQSFDLASHIVGISDAVNPSASQTYQYDALDRLIVAQTGNPVTHTQQFVYDEIGNRQNATIDGNAVDLFYGTTNNHLQTISGAVSANYLNGATALTFTYNNANRLVMIQISGTTLATYGVNALGQRVSKTVSGITTRFVYDEQGHLLGEYDGNGNLIQETVWLENLPVATLRPTGAPGNPTPIAFYYVHADHLGSPRAVTRPGDNVLMWQWDNLDPFGANAANETPSGQGVFKYGLRFPGQYYDGETGTNYNYHRDYDPSIGRYEQSDPIGLWGGTNTYIYAVADPIRHSDPSGLDTAGCDAIPNFLESPCALRCCAKHDQCFDRWRCTGASWYKDDGCVLEQCDTCNSDAKSCFNKCRANSQHNQSWSMYYCAKLHRYITIPGDFRDQGSAEAACEHDHSKDRLCCTK
jgi:RHS repeat-associated protein